MNSNMGMAIVCMIEKKDQEILIYKNFYKNSSNKPNSNILKTTESPIKNIINNKINDQFLINSTKILLTTTSIIKTEAVKTSTEKTNNIKNISSSLLNNQNLFNNLTTKYNKNYQLNQLQSVKQLPSASKVHWSAEDQGWIFGAFNAGLLCMLVTGFLADKFNAKYMIIVSVLMASGANIMIPLIAEYR